MDVLKGTSAVAPPSAVATLLFTPSTVLLSCAVNTTFDAVAEGSAGTSAELNTMKGTAISITSASAKNFFIVFLLFFFVFKKVYC